MVTGHAADLTGTRAAGCCWPTSGTGCISWPPPMGRSPPRTLPDPGGGGACQDCFTYGTPVTNCDLHRARPAGPSSRSGRQPLLRERAIRRGEVVTRQLQGALNSSVLIEQAKGVVAQQTPPR